MLDTILPARSTPTLGAFFVLRGVLLGRRYSRIAYLVLLLFWCSTAPAQVKNTKLLSEIPPTLREKLIRRLELFVEYDHKGEYEKQFDLLTRSYPNVGAIAREAYAKDRRNGIDGPTIVGTFSTMSIYGTYPEHWNGSQISIRVTVRAKYHGKTRPRDWDFRCYLWNENWYFDYIAIDY